MKRKYVQGTKQKQMNYLNTRKERVLEFYSRFKTLTEYKGIFDRPRVGWKRNALIKN
jgi:hypothetical protein